MTQWKRGQLSFYQSQRAEIVASSPRGSDCDATQFLPAFVSAICFYFQFYVSVLQLSAIVVYLSSQQAQQSASEPKEYSATVQNSASVPNSASVRNLDDASGHKAIKIKKLRNHFKLNSIKTKLKQTCDNCSNLSASDPHQSKGGEKYNTKTLDSSRNMRKFVA